MRFVLRIVSALSILHGPLSISPQRIQEAIVLSRGGHKECALLFIVSQLLCDEAEQSSEWFKSWGRILFKSLLIAIEL